jgi:PIN domain nuclease of toxin-antitoxin system
MRYLLDTHSFLWFVDDTADLPAHIGSLIVDPTNSLRISIASFWEMGIKAGLGKLPLSNTLTALESIAVSQSIEILPITVQAIEYAQSMAQHHKDPFDRIIAATAATMGDILLSADTIFDKYGVARLWT